MPYPYLSFLIRLALASALATSGCSADLPARSEAGPYAATPRPEVTVSSGRLRGIAHGDVEAFWGIPYATSTAGDARWRPPVAVSTWQGTRDADQHVPACAQMAIGSDERVSSVEEDCLAIDVYTPSTTSERPLPVMVWFYGGAFLYGRTDEYDGAMLASKGVVLVMASYRVGPLGFAAHPSLDDGEVPLGVGNYGLRDQQLALAWVQQNAAAFGGDPSNVTIFGQSAGATSSCLHLVSPLSAGLFHRAILQSGSCQNLVASRAAGEDKAVQMARALGCEGEDAAACLRGKSAEEVMLAAPPPLRPDGSPGLHRLNWGPTVDGLLIPEAPRTLLGRGEFHQVPVLLGTNLDEGGFFVFVYGLLNLDEEAFVTFLNRDYPPELVAQIQQKYPLASYESPSAALAEVFGDSLFHCPMSADAERIAEQGIPIYQYHFTQPIPSGFLSNLGTVHGAELPFVFGSTVQNAYFLAEEDLSLSETMMGYWTRFATTGDPNGDDAPAWPRIGPEENVYLELNKDQMAVKANLRESLCELWDARVDL